MGWREGQTVFDPKAQIRQNLHRSQSLYTSFNTSESRQVLSWLETPLAQGQSCVGHQQVGDLVITGGPALGQVSSCLQQGSV